MCAAKNTKDIFTTLFCFLLPGLLPAQLIAAPYQQGTDSNDLVSIEAKGFDSNVSQGGKSWTNSYPSGYSGTGALITSPNTGTNNNTGYVTNSPRLDYVLNFVKTGVHYVWIRGAGQTNGDDSLHVGLDGVAISSSNRISNFSTGLSWSNTQMGGTVAKINVATVGEHTLNIWMREDGTVFDKIVLTTNRTYTPTNKGPSASVRSATDNAPPPDPTNTSYQQGTDSNDLVSIEAKGFDSNVSQGGKSWTNSYPSGYSGTGALITSPNTGTNNNTGYVTNSPRLDYVLNFVKTGVHYVWIRGAGQTNGDDSLHVGLDGVAISSSNRISNFSTGLSWSNTQMGGTVAKINVATVGEHTLNIWMREDGTVFDKIVLTTNRTYTPTNKGPSASVRSATDNAPPPDPTNTSYQQGTDSNDLVSIEAKGFDSNVSQGGKSWTNSYPSGYSGTGALITSPNTGTNNNTGYVTNSPRLDYVLNFVKTGVHYVWIRGAGQTNGDDSLHVGLDGVAISSSNRISNFSTGLSWSNTQMGGTVAKINVATVGEHTLNIWMREDGTVFDKIVLTTNRAYTPVNKGPSASLRGTTESASYEPVAVLSTNSLDFGNQDVGGISNPSSVRLTNSGTAPLYISGIMASAGFIQTSDCNDTVSVGGSCVINVEFVPTSTGTITGSLTINSNADSSSVVKLVGTGTDGSQPLSSLTPSGPIVIKGESDVVISGKHITNPNGDCIVVAYNASNITIKDNIIGPCGKKGISIHSDSHHVTVTGNYIHDTELDAVWSYEAYNITVDSNTMERVQRGFGMWTTSKGNLSFTNNFVKNIIGGSVSNGAGGNMAMTAFVGGPGIRINNNIAVNVLGESRTEDLISIYKSSGKSDDPIQVNNNKLLGGGPSLSGGGINLGDSGGSYQEARNNILVNPGAYGISISAGRNMVLADNKVFSDDKRSFTNGGMIIAYQALKANLECSNLEVSNNEITFWQGSDFLPPNTDPYLMPYGEWGNCGAIDGWNTNKFDIPKNQPANLDMSLWNPDWNNP